MSDEGEAVHPDFLTIQVPAWGLYVGHDDPDLNDGYAYPRPSVPYDPEEFERLRKLDAEYFRVEYESQWRGVTGGYLDEVSVKRALLAFCPRCGRPSDTDHCPDCGCALRSLDQQLRGSPVRRYWCHIDIGYTESNFAAAIGHIEHIGTEEAEEHIVIDRTFCRTASEFGGHVDYEAAVGEVVEALRSFPSLAMVSFDGYGAALSIADMRARLAGIGNKARVKEINQNAGYNLSYWEALKRLLGAEQFHLCRDDFASDGRCLAELELRYLQRVKTRIDHPSSGPVQTKDIADCLGIVTLELLNLAARDQNVTQRIKGVRLAAGAQGGYSAGLFSGSRGLEGIENFNRNRRNRRWPNA